MASVTFERVQIMMNAMFHANSVSLAEMFRGLSDFGGEDKCACKPDQLRGEEAKYNELKVKFRRKKYWKPKMMGYRTCILTVSLENIFLGQVSGLFH